MGLGNKEVFANNLKRYMNKHDINRSELSKILNVGYMTVSDWTNAKTYPRIDKIEMLANYFNIEKSDLIERKPSNIIDIEEIKQIPVISEVAGGKPIFSEDNYDRKIAFSSDLLPNGDCFFVKCIGDSMKDTIADGDLVLIRQQDEVENNEIACVVFQDEDSMATLKRVKKANGSMLLIPDNIEHESYLVKEEDNVRILGKAIMRLNKF